MAISNTSILIKRSSSTATPSSLQNGELAYSFSSNTIFIGGPGSSVLKIGGQAYTSQIDAATSSNTVSTLVKRDSSGGFSGQLYGNANTASSLQNAQNFSISGGDITATGVAFYGNNAVTLNASLNSIPGLSANTYGSTSAVPVITVAANGRITNVTTQSISTSFTVSGNTGSGSQAGGGTLTLQGGGTGITTTVTGSGGSETVTFNTDTTIARTNTSSVGPQTFNTDINLPTNNLTVGGSINVAQLYISGNIYQTNATQTLNVGDPIIYLASNNTGNLVDIGFVGHFVGTGHSGDTSHYQHTGFVRDYNDNKWKLFSNVSTEPSTTVNFAEANTVYDVIKIGGIDLSSGSITAANNISATSLTLSNALTVPNGGTGATSFNNGQVLIGSGTGALTTLANSTFTPTGTGATNSTVTSLTVDAYGRVTAATYSSISGLTVSQGGTGQSSFTNGQLIVGSGTNGLQSIANVSTTVTGSLATNNTVTSITTDAYGRLTAYTGSAISGLTVGQGGTGQNSFTTNGIVFGNGTGGLGVTALAGSADQTWSNQILTVTNAGVPVWSSALDGGTF
jgi:hypothetical protein